MIVLFLLIRILGQLQPRKVDGAHGGHGAGRRRGRARGGGAAARRHQQSLRQLRVSMGERREGLNGMETVPKVRHYQRAGIGFGILLEI